MNLKEAKKKAKETGETVHVDEASPPSTVKVNISIRLDLDLLQWLKDEAKNQGLPYQTLAHSILRRAMLAKSLEIIEVGHLEQALAKMKQEIANIEPRLANVEHMVQLKQG